MSIELTHEFNQPVKRVDFFPYEWSSNLLAVCFNESVKLFIYHDNTSRKEDDINSFISQESNIGKQKKLQLIATVPFQQKIEQFSWSPKTSISSLKQNINFAISDCTQNLIFCNFNLNSLQDSTLNDVPLSNMKFLREKVDVDCIYHISYDNQNGELLAFTADNFCFIWDCPEVKVRARFLLQSPGTQICWNRSEKTKLMVGEKSGLIRIYSIETLKPLYTLMSNLKIENFPLISFDWSESNPETIISNTANTIFIWNTYKSCLPENTIENFKRLRSVKLSQVKENLIGFIDGRDAASKLTILNFKSNQILYQTDNYKLLSSFSFNAVQTIIALSTEQQLIFIKLLN